MVTSLLTVAVLSALGYGFARTCRPGVSGPLAALTAAAYCAVAVLAVGEGDWASAVIAAVTAVLYVWLWWRDRNRRNRKGTLRMLGNKARARVEAMVRNMPKPGRVLRPVPQGG